MNTHKKLEEVWPQMEDGIRKLKNILEGVPGESQFDSDTYMRLYTTVYDLCTQQGRHDDAIHGIYIETYHTYLRSRVLPAIQEKHDVFMLRELMKRSNHEVMNGEEIDRTLVKHVLEFFVNMDVSARGGLGYYVNDFEKAFLTDTADYYTRKASSWIQEDSCPDYMIKAEECLKREKDSVNNFLHSSTEEKLLEKVQEHLLLNNAQQLLEKEHSGCHVLLRDDKITDLNRMYRLFVNIKNGLDPITAAFKRHVTSEGTSILKQADDAMATGKKEDKAAAGMQEQAFVRRLIELHDKYYAYVTNCFKKDNLFYKALKEAFEVFCNKSVGGSSVAELFSTFSESILRKGGSSEKLSDDAIEETLDKIVTLLAYIDDKDLFAEFCRKKLARRLLFDKNSADDDHERSFLSKLKQQCGGQFTSKMEGMVTDLALARDLQTGYDEYVNNNDLTHPGTDFNVTVLTTGYWPTYKTLDLNLPTEMRQCVQAFKEFYQSKTNNKKLTYLFSPGSCSDLIVSTHQACVLMLFNDSDKLSYSEIRAQLNLTDDDVVRLLHSLSCAKYKILTKEPNTKTISKKDSFSWNVEFTDKMRRIKIPLPPVDEKKKVIEDVDKDRRFAIDASIVRIMKARKVLQYNELVTACVEQLSRMFKPDFKVIKRRIEDLIAREFLERDKDNTNTFKYLA
ncbi:hypothetical protein MKW98_008752 [Papaver atlanticum]|uniref:Cullin family profile domain-containing protein n=1 Tax=Papaver atlanticum TaxID=357466 RepID=A0AAD4TAQ0_9MAGN|nr:hypothetical protein MKW98_008752 [Papaver atlanticum]